MTTNTNTTPLTSRGLADEIAARLVENDGDTYVAVRGVKAVLATLAEVVADEIANGVPVAVPGVAKLTVGYVAPKPKRNATDPRTGETVVRAATAAKMRLRARPATSARRALPSARSVAGKRVAAEATAKQKERAKRAAARERAAHRTAA